MSLALNYGWKLENVDDALHIHFPIKSVDEKQKKRKKINILINKGAYCVLLNLNSLLKIISWCKHHIRKVIYMSV